MVKKVPAADTPKTRKVRVHEQRTYVDEEPVIDVEAEDVIEVEEANPIQAFLSAIDNSRSLTMKVFLLPNFYKDGKRSIRANERPFVTQFPFSNEDIQDYQQKIQQACPAGGMFQIELREGWQVVRIWEEPIAAAPGYQEPSAATRQQNTYPIIVNPAMNPQPPPAASPVDVMREQMSLAKDLVSMAKDLAPVAPVVHVGNGTSAEPGERPLEEKLFETVLIKALESGKTPIEKVLDAMSGRRSEPGVMEMVLEVAKVFAPTIDRITQEFIAMQKQARAQAPQQAAAAPANLGTLPAEPVSTESATEGEPQSPQPAPDPASRAWFKTLVRALEDCTEHVELQKVSADSISVVPAAEAIADLVDRFPEQLEATITQVLETSPEQVLELAAMMLGEQGRAHIEAHLKPFPVALTWIAELQETCKNILSEASLPDTKESSDEDKRTD